MQIGEFARLAGVSASAIRFYEKRGLMPPEPPRVRRRLWGLSYAAMGRSSSMA
jgi:DNA-binding transcriptional MerR regulator